MSSLGHTAAFTSAALFALALSAGAQSAAPPAAAAECHPTGYATTKTGRVVTFHITTKTDRFSGVTTTQTNFLPIPGAAIVNLYAWTHSNASRELGILIATESSGLRYTSCRQTYLLADGKPVLITEVKHYSSKVIKPGSSERVGYAGRAGRLGFLGLGFDINTSPLFLEIVGVNLSADALAQLGAASKIEFKVCNDETVASTEFVQAAHELGCMVAAETPSAPNAAPAPTTASPQEPPPFSPPPAPAPPPPN